MVSTFTPKKIYTDVGSRYTWHFIYTVFRPKHHLNALLLILVTNFEFLIDVGTEHCSSATRPIVTTSSLNVIDIK